MDAYISAPNGEGEADRFDTSSSTSASDSAEAANKAQEIVKRWFEETREKFAAFVAAERLFKK